MKQKPISAFFGASAKKDEGGKSTQAKISAFFGAGAKTPAAAAKTAAAATTPAGGAAATPEPGPAPTPAPNAVEPSAAKPPPPADADAPPPAAAAAAKPKAPAGGSTSKPKAAAPAAKGSAAKASAKDAVSTKKGDKSADKADKADKSAVKAKGDGKAKKAKAADGGKAGAKAKPGMKRLRRVIVEEEEEGDKAEAGLEDDLEDEEASEDRSEGSSEYEASGSESDSEFSADEEGSSSGEEEDDEEEESEGEGENGKVGGKRKKPPTKAAAPAKRGGAASAKAPAKPTTPAAARTPAAVASTPAHGTASKGPAAATAMAGRATPSAAAATPVGGGPGSAARSGGARSLGGGAGGGAATPSSVRSGRTSDCGMSESQGAVSEVSLGVSACMDGDAGRFVERMSNHFPFLTPDRIMDAAKRRPDHPDYDPRTLFIPTGWFKEAKISDGQQQWWTLKAANFDSVLLFKVGKFYEMFEMDAFVGVDVLGLSFMKGDQPHAGFPEIKYADMAEALARAGYRVVVVEQTETPDMLKERNEQRKKQGLKAAAVVDRQKVAVLSRGTLVDAEMVASRPDAAYVLAVAEIEEPAAEGEEGAAACGRVRIGLCAVDAAAGQILLGEFLDDDVRSALRTQLTALQPLELVLPRQALSATTATVLRNGTRSPQVNQMRGAAGEWSAEKTYKMLRDFNYFTASAAASTTPADGTAAADPWAADGAATGADGGAAAAMEVDGDGGKGGGACPPELDPSRRWPALLRRMVAEGVGSRPAAMAALGGVITFLKDALLDRAVLPLGRFEELPALASAVGAGAEGGEAGAEGPRYLALNGAALENLEILENGEGGSAGTLLSVLDHCTTPFGRRRLRQWLCRPLGRIPDIEARQDAVEALMGGELAEAAGATRKLLAGISDLERAITRLHATTVEGAGGRNAANVILYEDAGKRRVAALVGAIKDLRSAVSALEKLRGALGGGGPELLRRIVNTRCRPAEVVAALEEIEGVTDWSEAAKTGRAVPEPGVDEEFDAAVEEVSAAESTLNDYLKEVRSQLGSKDVSYVHVNKDPYLLELPEALEKRAGKAFHLVGARKGFKRFTTDKLRGLVADRARALEAKEDELSRILQRLVVRFVSHKALWVRVVEAVADLDALMSLAGHALAPPDGGPMCRPRLVPPIRLEGAPEGSPATAAVFEALELRHPAGIGGRNNGAFVPNDVRLGGTVGPDGSGFAPSAPFVLLSGPNMGGKSTLLRQVCLATVLAQVGAFVPASSLTLSPADAVFVRMGARDSIMTGQSTFFIELAETAAMLARATPDSLVVLDELGRGTATLDGAAVAGAVLAQLAGGVRCRGLFATHYHHLSDEHAADPGVAVMHMACAVEGQEEDSEGLADKPAEGGEEVTFLYRLTMGACPKSYGTNVARLAGLPASVVARAAEVSAMWDQGRVGALAAAAGAAAADGPEGTASGAEAMDVDGGAEGKGKQEEGGEAGKLRALAAELKAALAGAGGAEEGAVARLRDLQAAARAAIAAA
ncbi:hypothetical protein HYH03_005657 [Edaphochlamys debaryana]|uniref:DNA mismatch repair protein n=1 Tax=Edaphochlamys debaryana TaxID=47281 RepID=A0A835Y7Y9_9CHLO|nr:hypothetical protein HYH03_005657 [Edaphochlamys debaryana]|eukprot:KAG2496433.1 hypothetical protein HYH03_005657 [Edaphochlamys debaryana]